ncbi:flavodoxin family protein [Mucilaginibacter terrigena]|uniref:Flavodoxin family protein n=1 Tax=Mucilaginibacter terrigena TaxID=2492395 RepID=A0A4V1ZC99_9SPHI|nr:flavodoxin family protein [Mucilaginibacter terrigena]RYU91920.1 flavodoxin family protein [Mucilaginibacter terrigena]
MQKIKIAIVFHSGYGHTRKAAELIAERFRAADAEVHLVDSDAADKAWGTLHTCDTIIFGCPTYFGTVSAGFKTFMERTGGFWYRQLWKDKFAAAFTVSSTLGGDKQNTLQTIAVFAAQHSMHWINLGVLPRFCADEQTDGQNRLASYQGLMIQSDNTQTEVREFHPGDLLTLELFADRILQVNFKNIIKQSENEQTIN